MIIDLELQIYKSLEKLSITGVKIYKYFDGLIKNIEIDQSLTIDLICLLRVIVCDMTYS